MSICPEPERDCMSPPIRPPPIRSDQCSHPVSKTNHVYQSSLYTMNLGVLNVNPITQENKRCSLKLFPNRMSDRLYPSVGFTRNIRNKRALGPGQISAGGVGVDIKHGSYHRYLQMKKGGLLTNNIKNIITCK